MLFKNSWLSCERRRTLRTKILLGKSSFFSTQDKISTCDKAHSEKFEEESAPKRQRMLFVLHLSCNLVWRATAASQTGQTLEKWPWLYNASKTLVFHVQCGAFSVSNKQTVVLWLFVPISTFHVHTTQQHHRLCSLGATKPLSALPPPPASCRPAHGTRAAAAKTRCREERTAFILSSRRYEIQS
jgi:hypothetical protein